MKIVRYSLWIGLLALVVGLPVVASATPSPTQAVLITRVFNDCPVSILVPTNNYSAYIAFDEWNTGTCVGFANLHLWRLSDDGVNPTLFPNNSHFSLSSLLKLSGTGQGEGGLQIRPWWSVTDGRFNVRTTDGEIACFGGRLPFYSFTAGHGITYTKGSTVLLKITYLANGLSIGDPATIQYQIQIGINTYNSPWIPFDEGNPAEGFGSWGILDQAQVGGHDQNFVSTGPDFKAEWSDICFTNLDAVPTVNTTWGRIKDLYR